MPARLPGALVIGVAAIAMGAALAVMKGNGVGLGYYLGNLSAPYLLVSFVAGRAARRPRAAAVSGILGTWAALIGFYAAAAIAFDYLSIRLLHLYVEWFVAGAISGAVVGLLGLLSRSKPWACYVLPVAFLIEPAAVSAVRLAGRFGGWALPPLQLLAWGIELCLGISALVLTAAVLRGSRRRHRLQR